MHPLQLPELMAIVAKYLDATVSEARLLTRVCNVWYTVFSPTIWHNCPISNAFIKNEQAVQGLARKLPTSGSCLSTTSLFYLVCYLAAPSLQNSQLNTAWTRTTPPSKSGIF